MQNFSVGIWGPQLWSVLHGIAKLAEPQDARAVSDMLNGLHTLLPCIMCARDFPRALSSVIAKRKESVEQATKSNRLVEFMYDVHNEVNRKLSRQRYEKLRNVIPSLPANPDIRVLDILESNLSLTTLQRRSAVFQDCPWNVGANWILVVIMSNRVDSKETLNNLVHFMMCLSYYTGKFPSSRDYMLAASTLKSAYLTLNQTPDYRACVRIIAAEYTSFSKQEFGARNNSSVQEIISTSVSR